MLVGWQDALLQNKQTSLFRFEIVQSIDVDLDIVEKTDKMVQLLLPTGIISTCGRWSLRPVKMRLHPPHLCAYKRNALVLGSQGLQQIAEVAPEFHCMNQGTVQIIGRPL